MTTWDEHGRPDDVDWLAIPVSGYPLPERHDNATGLDPELEEDPLGQAAAQADVDA